MTRKTGKRRENAHGQIKGRSGEDGKVDVVVMGLVKYFVGQLTIGFVLRSVQYVLLFGVAVGHLLLGF